MDSAYDRTNPVCSFRIRPEVPPIAAASVFTSPSTPRLSKYTDSRVSHWPGRIRTDSLNASPYRSFLAATTGNRPRGASAGTGTRPYIAQARPPAAMTSTRVTTPETENTPCEDGGNPVTGPRKFSNRCPTIRNAPAPTEPTASRIIGQVIVPGDSCGWVSAAQRRLPNQVISITRVM